MNLESLENLESLVLRFTSALNFEATGNRVPFAMLKERDTEKESAETERIALMHALREEGKTLQEIADMLGLSTSTVHRLIHKKS